MHGANNDVLLCAVIVATILHETALIEAGDFKKDKK